MTTPTKDYAEVDRTLGPVLNEHLKLVNNYKSLEQQLAAADGDRAAALQAFIDSSDDPQVIKLRGVIEQAQAKLSDIAEKNVKSEQLSDEDKAKLAAALDAEKAKIRDGYKATLSIAETMKAVV